jgi:hypothetical protein
VYLKFAQIVIFTKKPNLLYYSGLYSSLSDEKQGNGEFVKKKKVDFQWIFRILKKHEYTCIYKNNFQTTPISSERRMHNCFLTLKESGSNLCLKSGILVKNYNFCKFKVQKDGFTNC